MYVLHNQQQYNQKHTAHLHSLCILPIYTHRVLAVVVFYNPFSSVLTALH